MTLAERLAALQAERQAAWEEAAHYRRLAARAAQAGDTAAQTVADLRACADAASARAFELSEQIETIQVHLDESRMTDHAALRTQIQNMREQLAALERGAAASDEADLLRRQLRQAREELLSVEGERLALAYLASARQLLRTALELRAFADFASVFGVKLDLDLDALSLPLPRGDRPGFRAYRAEDLRVDAAALAEARRAATAQWEPWLVD